MGGGQEESYQVKDVALHGDDWMEFVWGMKELDWQWDKRRN